MSDERQIEQPPPCPSHVPDSFIREFMAHRHFWAAKDIDIVARKDSREYRLEGDWLKPFIRALFEDRQGADPEDDYADRVEWKARG